MCTVSVKVNEALLRGMRPELNSTAAIRQWAQEQDEDLLLKPSEIVDDGGEAIDLETFRADLHRMVDEVYAEP